MSWNYNLKKEIVRAVSSYYPMSAATVEAAILHLRATLTNQQASIAAIQHFLRLVLPVPLPVLRPSEQRRVTSTLLLLQEQYLRYIGVTRALAVQPHPRESEVSARDLCAAQICVLCEQYASYYRPSSHHGDASTARLAAWTALHTFTQLDPVTGELQRATRATRMTD